MGRPNVENSDSLHVAFAVATASDTIRSGSTGAVETSERVMTQGVANSTARLTFFSRALTSTVRTCHARGPTRSNCPHISHWARCSGTIDWSRAISGAGEGPKSHAGGPQMRVILRTDIVRVAPAALAEVSVRNRQSLLRVRAFAISVRVIERRVVRRVRHQPPPSRDRTCRCLG
jgi:hypothetical protein